MMLAACTEALGRFPLERSERSTADVIANNSFPVCRKSDDFVAYAMRKNRALHRGQIPGIISVSLIFPIKFGTRLVKTTNIALVHAHALSFARTSFSVPANRTLDLVIHGVSPILRLVGFVILLHGIDAPICQDERSSGLGVSLARLIVCHDTLIVLAGEETFEAPDNLAFGPVCSAKSRSGVDCAV